MDWRRKIDEKERREKEQELARQRQLETQIEAENTDAKKLERLQKAFVCHIRNCGKRPTRPGEERKFSAGTDFLDGYDYSIVNWSLPGDLDRCKRCSQWTCLDHLYKGICKACADRMPEPPAVGKKQAIHKTGAKAEAEAHLITLGILFLAFLCLCPVTMLIYWQIMLPWLSGPK